MYTNVQSIVADARQRMDPALWDFVIYGAESEATLCHNRAAIDALAWRPRIMRDVGVVDCTASLFGRPMRIPVVLSPVGSIARFDAEGAAAATRAARGFGIRHVMSSHARDDRLDAEDLSSTVYALHPTADRAALDRELEVAAAGGYCGVSVASQSTYYGRRERDLINGFKGKIDGTRFYSRMRIREADGRRATVPIPEAGLSWELLDYIRGKVKGPLILKGVLTREDALQALECGCDAVYVSNNGGRALDYAVGTVDVLGEIAEAVDGRVPIIVDGGFVRGNDVLKALALGATAVAIGRLQALALSAGGAAALTNALEILEEEMIVTMGYLGVTKIADLTPAYLSPHRYPPRNGYLSAFPALGDGF